MNEEKIPQLATAGEIEKITPWGKSQIYSMAKRGLIPCYRIGTMVRFSPREIKQLLKQFDAVKNQRDQS